MKTWRIGQVVFQDDGQKIIARHPSGYVDALTDFVASEMELEISEVSKRVMDFVERNVDNCFGKVE